MTDIFLEVEELELDKLYTLIPNFLSCLDSFFL